MFKAFAEGWGAMSRRVGCYVDKHVDKHLRLMFECYGVFDMPEKLTKCTVFSMSKQLLNVDLS